MASRSTVVKAWALAALFLLSGSLSQFYQSDIAFLETDNLGKKPSDESNSTTVIIPNAESVGVGPSLEMPSNHALQSVSFSVEPGNGYRHTGFEWSDWSLPGFQSLGLIEESDGALILGFQGINYDFDNGTEGWTSSNSNYAQHNTASTCGMSGNTGASWWTRGGSVTVTSPVVNIAGYQGLSLNAWVRQGNYGCGEEPDTNEDFYLEYKNTNNGWSQIQYLQGSTSGGSVTNVNYNLPANAYHSDFQIRARQTSGSGTSYDYWFFDNIIVPGTTGATLTTRSFGWASGSDESMDEGEYPPIYIDALIPDGAYLNWTVMDSDTGSAIPGLVNRTGKLVDLSSVNWKIHDSLKLELEFSSNAQGESPRLYAISGGGKIHDALQTNPIENGWTMKDASWSKDLGELYGTANSIVTSPIFDIDMPFNAFKLDKMYDSNLSIMSSVDFGDWTVVDLSQEINQLENASSSIQFQFSGLSPWVISEFGIELFPSVAIMSPRMDIDSDGIYEWSATGNGIGNWGNQDVFLDGNESITFDVGLNPTSWHNILIPREATSFEVSVDNVGTIGLGVQTLALWIGNSIVSQTGGNGFADGLRLSLNESELDDLNFLSSSGPVTYNTGGSEFIVGKIETITDAGKYRLGGLTISYQAGELVTSTAVDEQVLAINRARMESSKSTSLPLTFSASSQCELDVEIKSYTTSGHVSMQGLSWKNYSETLTPSNMWRELTTEAQVHHSSPHRLILNLYSDNHVAMWFIPLQGGNIISTGSDDSLIFGPDTSSNVTGNVHQIKHKFRLAQNFEDQSYLRIESRIQLASGVVSMPLIEIWNTDATNNDLIIQSMSILSDRGIVPETDNYLMASDSLRFDIDIGFEKGDQTEKPYPGEYLVELLQNGIVVANSSNIQDPTWVVNATTPFTSGNVNYSARVIPLAGGDLGEPSEISREFVIDPLSPVVIGANIRHYDHRVSSSSQEIIINITDQPQLPTDVTLMLWTEWSNDLDGDGLPSDGEYIPRMLNNPSNLSAKYGSYYTYIDDTSAFPGEKVAGYITGQDPSGYPIIGGGSQSPGDHLFMYQIMTDGSPSIDDEGFQWVDGRRAWLHPEQTYSLNISFRESNGISDLSHIRVLLADNFQSDRLMLMWDNERMSCSSETIHILVKSCKINDRNGLTPDPFDTDLVLNMIIQPLWTLPDLGEFRREPSVTVTDRAGNQEIRTFPENRWRFSSEMMILDNTTLWVQKGVLLSDGARVSPGSSMELSGHLVFVRSMEVPQFDCRIDTRLNGLTSDAIAVDGSFTVSLFAPISSGHHALTWMVDCMPEQGIDMTASTTSVKWILVDTNGPEIVEFISPRESSILSVGVHDVKVVISENYGIDSDSVEMIWWVTTHGDNTALISGSSQLVLNGDNQVGLRLEFTGSVDLSDIPIEFLQKQLVLKMRFEGRDLAGNVFQTSQNSNSNPAGIWSIEHYVPYFSIDSSGVELSKLELEVDETTIVQIHVKNDGKMGGNAQVVVEVVDLNGDRKQLTMSTVFVESQSIKTHTIDWKPSEPGIQKIEVKIGENIGQSEFIDVKPTEDEKFLEDTLGSTNPWILGTTILMLFLSLVFVFAWMRAATFRHRDTEIDWEYEDEEVDF